MEAWLLGVGLCGAATRRFSVNSDNGLGWAPDAADCHYGLLYFATLKIDTQLQEKAVTEQLYCCQQMDCPSRFERALSG